MRILPFFLLLCAASPALAQEASPIAAINFDLAQVGERPAGPTTQPAPEEPDADQITPSASVTVASGRIFQDQRFVLSSDPVAELSLGFSYRGWDLNVWRAEPFDGKRENRETDLTLSHSCGSRGQVTVTCQVGVYFIPDTDAIYEAKVSVGLPIGHGFSLEASAEIMRGGFRDEVLRGQLSYSHEIAERVTVDAAASLSLSSFGNGASFGYEAGISYELNSNLSLRGYLTGFTSSVGSGRVFGLSLSWTP